MGESSAGRYTVDAAAGDAGARLDQVLARALPALSRTRLKALILEGCVASGGAVITEPSRRVKPGERFAIVVPAAAPPVPAGQDIALAVLHEDADLIVIAKPAGMTVHPAPGSPDRTLVNALIAHCGASLSGIGGVARPGIVHRLDKDTSGVMLAAKTDRAHAALSAQFARHSVERTYRALVWGVPQPAAGRIEGAIGRSPRNRKKMAVVERGGKAAVTHYRVLRDFGGVVSLIECRLETGRTHQIRVHLTHIGHPLLGDPVYGRSRRLRAGALPAAAVAAVHAFSRQALHAQTLGFEHPVAGRMLRFEAPPPEDFVNLIKVLEKAPESPEFAVAVRRN